MQTARSHLRIIVGGMVAQYPLGGVAWDYLQYMIGLLRLGHDVYYHEDTWTWPYDPSHNTPTSRGEYSAGFLAEFFRRYAPQLQDRWHYDHLHEQDFGMSGPAFRSVARTADVFLNVSGACAIPAVLSPRCCKVFLDTDPGYNQILYLTRPDWAENVDRWCDEVDAHDCHFTYAESFHDDDCQVPQTGHDWQTTRMPIVMDLWRQVAAAPAVCEAAWTTIMTWNNFRGPLVYAGKEYKSKGAEFAKLLELPSLVNENLAVAVGGSDAPAQTLAAAGWQVADAPRATLTPQSYQQFIAHSRGEISTAKHVYVALKTGWFSCRSACYMACGRPVVLQDTGFSRHVPCGQGVLAFDDLQQAADAIGQVEADYQTHCRAADQIASAEFGADRVLKSLLDRACN